MKELSDNEMSVTKEDGTEEIVKILFSLQRQERPGQLVGLRRL